MIRSLSLNLDNVLEFLSGLFLILLFPGFFIYHDLLALGLLPELLAGWFGPVSLLAAVLFAPSLLLLPSKPGGKLGVSLVLAFLSLLVASGYMVLLAYSLDDGIAGSAKSSALTQYLTVVTAWVALFCIGYHTRLEARLARHAQLLFFVMASMAWSQFDRTTMMFYAARDLRISEGVASYQGFARSFVVTTMVVLASASQGWQLLVTLVSVPTMFILGARSELVGLILVLALWLGVRCRTASPRSTLTAVASIALLVWAGTSNPAVRASRQFELLDLGSSTSWTARSNFLVEGLATVRANPIAGNWGKRVMDRGVGGNIHNVMSAWEEFGLVVFVIYLTLSAGALAGAVSAVLRHEQSRSRSELALYVNAFSVLMLVFAKGVYWPVPAFGWGLTAGLYSHRNCRMAHAHRARHPCDSGALGGSLQEPRM